MTRDPVIFDTNSLIYFTRVNEQCSIINLLRSIFSAIHIPDEVYLEYYKGAIKDQARQTIINLIESNSQFWVKCTAYDTISKVFYETHTDIDKGEAAALAQQTKIFARYIISDDIKFTEKAKGLGNTATIITSMHLLAILDIHRYNINWTDCIRYLYTHRKFTTSQLRSAYKDVASWYGIKITKETLSLKTSFKKIGLKI